jgi:hypothetical protein
MYYKYLNQYRILPAPQVGKVDQASILNFPAYLEKNPAKAKELGYKKLEYVIRPEYNKYTSQLKQKYIEEEEVIVCGWEIIDLPKYKKISYSDLVNQEIRKKYNESEEFSILRQKEEKPEEYQEYYNYCEECKIKAKELLELT